jgi:hypothetical protein
LYPVDGSVTYQGEPARGATVVFFPEGNDSLTAVIPSGGVGEYGTFTINTNGKPGAPAGKYRVVIHIPARAAPKPPAPKAGLGDDPERKPDAPTVAAPFADRSTTALRAEVKSSPNKLEPFRLP